MTPDSSKKPDTGEVVRDTLSAFNADGILDDPDNLDNHPKPAPAATPDSPNPI